MKKLLTIAFAMLLGATLSVAQATGGAPASTDKTATTTKKPGKSHTHGKKGGKKGKKSSGGTTTPAPK
jgi:hypothetical protein